MGETGFHVHCAIAIVNALSGRYRAAGNVYVGAKLFVYFDPGDPSKVVCPDVFVALGVSPHERRIWKVWEEGKGPDVVFEITSKGTRKEDRYVKPDKYEDLGVREYYLFDPLGEYLKPRLQGYQLAEAGYQPVASADADRLTSEILGLELFALDNLLRFYDPATGKTLPLYAELEETAREAEERAQAEAAARAQAEARLAALEAELRRLRGEANS